MSIASELADLQANLEAAQNAVQAAGGTVGDTGMSGLPTAIESIPSGGGSVPDYGIITIYNWSEGWALSDVYDCEVTVDWDMFQAYLIDNGYADATFALFNWQQEDQFWYVDGLEQSYTNEQLESELGITVVFDTPEDPYGSFYIGMEFNVDYDNPNKVKIELPSASQLEKLTYAEMKESQLYQYYDLGFVKIPFDTVYGFEFGTLIDTVPDGFLKATPVVEVDASNAAITTIGDSFLEECGGFDSSLVLPSVTSVGDNFLCNAASFDSTLVLDSLEYAGDNFLGQCSSYNQPLSLPSLISVGAYFLSDCSSFNQDLTFPDTVVGIGDAPMRYISQYTSIIDFGDLPEGSIGAGERSSAFTAVAGSAPAYTTGVRITGEYATRIKEVFPDEDGPGAYRKLIVVE